jgi:rod shape-determining protein MreC
MIEKGRYVMQKKKKISFSPRYILMIISFLCLILIVLSFRFQNETTQLRQTAGGVIIPMQNGINKVGRVISKEFQYATTVKKLVRQNTTLKKKLDEISAENKLLQQDKYDLENFRKLYDLDQQYAGYPKVAARVISSDPDNWYNTFIIDKGTQDGLSVNMNVMAGDGLVGIITECNKSYSRVRSIIDDESSVTGTFLKTTDNCNVSGNLKLMNKGVIELSNIANTAKIKDGYEVVTSQVSDKYLPGILIGYARDVKTDSTNMTKSGYLTPAADFTGLDMVLVITEVKDSGDLEAIMK